MVKSGSEAEALLAKHKALRAKTTNANAGIGRILSARQK